jgi:predicted nucleic acid-binding protein
LAIKPSYLADKSALARVRLTPVSTVLSPLVLAREVATCSIIELEVLYSARSYGELAATRANRAAGYPLVEMVQADFDHALDLMEELARRGLHRAVGIPDLLIASVAARAQLVLLHYDTDFDLVAAVTGQPMEWVVPRGSVP